MQTTSEFKVVIENFESSPEGVNAVLLGHDTNDKMHYLKFEQEYLPRNGKYPGATYDLTVTINSTPQGIMTKVGPATSIAEFAAEFREGDAPDYVYVRLYNDDGTWLGHGSFRSDQLPDGIVMNERTYYVTVDLRYDEEYTKQQWEMSDKVINKKRNQARQDFEEIFGVEYP